MTVTPPFSQMTISTSHVQGFITLRPPPGDPCISPRGAGARPDHLATMDTGITTSHWTNKLHINLQSATGPTRTLCTPLGLSPPCSEHPPTQLHLSQARLCPAV